MNNRDLYIFGEPIETKFGKVRFLTYKEYMLHSTELYILSQNVLHWYYLSLKQLSDKKEREELKKLKEAELIDIVKSNEEFMIAYIKIFSLVLDINEYSSDELQHVLALIVSDRDNFLEFRRLVLDMNGQIEDEVSPNEEIQSFIEKGRELKNRQNNNDGISVMDVITSLVVGTPHTYEEIGNMTILQVNATYSRLAKFKDYDTTTLFATVSGDVKISSWASHIDLFKQDKSGISEKEFNSKYGRLFK